MQRRVVWWISTIVSEEYTVFSTEEALKMEVESSSEMLVFI
jgi:hypothetical protein